MEAPHYWRLKKALYGTPSGGLLGSQCPEGHLQFPPRPVCPDCAIALLSLSQEADDSEVVKLFQTLIVSVTDSNPTSGS